MAAEWSRQVKRRAIFLAAIGLSISAPLAAADEHGSRNCRKWTEESRLAGGFKAMNKVPLLITKGWFLGYLTGRQSKSRQDFLGVADNESIFLWLDNYCRDHPQGDLERAGVALEQELSSEQGKAAGR